MSVHISRPVVSIRRSVQNATPVDGYEHASGKTGRIEDVVTVTLHRLAPYPIVLHPTGCPNKSQDKRSAPQEQARLQIYRLGLSTEQAPIAARCPHAHGQRWLWSLGGKPARSQKHRLVYHSVAAAPPHHHFLGRMAIAKCRLFDHAVMRCSRLHWRTVR
jgi:hypothetical protein